MNEQYINPFLIGLNLVLGVVMVDYLNIVAAILGVTVTVFANIRKVIEGFEFVRAYVNAGFRLPGRQVVEDVVLDKVTEDVVLVADGGKPIDPEEDEPAPEKINPSA